jgi:hypothetical protein
MMTSMMPKKFNIATADRQGLVDRVTQLTSALVKQKDTIAKMKSTEENLLSENERLQRQIRRLEEEGAVARELRGELQNEVARLQRSVDLLTAELQMHHGEQALLNSQTPSENRKDKHGEPGPDWPGASQGESAVYDKRKSSSEFILTDVCTAEQNSTVDWDSLREHLVGLNEYLLHIRGLSANPSEEDSALTSQDAVNGEYGCGLFAQKAAALLPKNIALIEMITALPSFEGPKQCRSSSGLASDGSGENSCVATTPQEAATAARLERELSTTEQGRAQAEERMRAAQQAYIQAKKCIEDQERVLADKEREIASLRQAMQRRGDTEAAEARRREQEAARLAAVESEMASRQEEARAAEERLAQAGRTAAALQARLAAAAVAAQEREEALEGAARRAEEREAQARRDAEAARGALEAVRRELRQAQEEKALQLEVDRRIIRGLQSEGRARAAELEARIASLEALLRAPHSDAAVGFLGAPHTDPHPAHAGPDADPDAGGGAATAALAVTAGAGIGVFGAAAGGGAGGAGGDFPDGGKGGAGGGVGEGGELIRRALRAMEDMVEALMRRPDLCRRIDADLAALEAELAAAAGRQGAGALERRVEALCGVVQIAADYLQEIPCPDPRALPHHHHGGGGGGAGGCWLARAVWRACCCCCCGGGGGGGRAAVGPAYAPVRSSGDYDDAL